MGGRIGKILLALWWALWTCVIVPGHTRGAMGVDGTLARGADGKTVAFFFSTLPSCCRPRAPAGAPRDKAPPSSDNCAICMIAANTGVGMDIPPIVDAPRQTPATLVLMAVRALRAAPMLTYRGRAPPQA